MLHVILTILAVIGIIILCILGLILLIVLLVLFWPVKYRINASYNDKKYLVNIKVYWLLGLICDRITINKKGFDNTIKVFGFKIGAAKQPEKKKPKAQKAEADKPAKPPDMPESKKEPEVLKRIRAEKAKEKTKKTKQPKGDKPNIFEKIKAFFIRLKDRFNTILEIIRDKNNKKSLGFIKNQIFYILKKIRPRKIKANIIFGLGDPALTGQALGGIAVVMGIIGKGFAIQPDFENKIIQGDIEIRGRIFIFSLLLVAIRVFRNKGLRRTYKKLKQLNV